MKRLLILLLCIGLFFGTACDLASDPNEIIVQGRELISDKVVDAHVSYFFSRYFEFDYKGEESFDIVLEAWEFGKYSHEVGRLIGIKGSELDGISVSVKNLNDGFLEFIIGDHGENGSGAYTLKVAKNITRGLGSRDIGEGKLKFTDSEEIYLLAVVLFQSEYRSIADVLGTAKSSDYSFVMKIIPAD